MRKLHNLHHPAGLEWAILKMLPKVLLAGIFIPLFMSIFIRLFPAGDSLGEIEKHISSIDILSISLFVTLLTAVFTIVIGCIIIVLMKGPAYVADAYELDDADEPEAEKKKSSENR
jgi:hypothetical protein